MSSRLERRLLNQISRTSAKWSLIEPDDRVLVAFSGGKDSFSLLWLLEQVRRRAPFDFELVPVHLDQGMPGHDPAPLVAWCAERGVQVRVLRKDNWSVVLQHVPAGKTACSVCARLRRGVLYDAAVELGCTKLALGHHRDDAIETLLLNVFFAGQLKSMPAWLRSDDGRNVVVRPLLSCAEEDLRAYAVEQGFPAITCGSCQTWERHQRQEMKELLARLSAENPKVKGNLFAALSHVVPSHLLDRALQERVGAEFRARAVAEE